MLDGRRILVTGVLDRHSIAFATAARAQELGAQVLLSGFGRTKRMTERAAGQLPTAAEVLELDVNSAADIEAVRAELHERWGALDGLLHAVAYAPPDALGGEFLSTPLESAVSAYQTSAFSLKALVAGLLPLLEAGGGEGGGADGKAGAGGAGAAAGAAVVGLDFDASVAWPSYDWMGVAKAALEAVARYLARDVGARGIRVNLVSAGPIETLAAGGIPGFSQLAEVWSQTAPLAWDVEDPGPVADAACFLLSPLARAITAEIVHVDGGFHAMGCASP
jgi:meromycolic acid enoyl-[acyl-carrier-protein] reductase